MGWFSGKASELHPMEGVAHSEAIVDLAGGPDKLCAKMEEALEEGRHQWALELADILIDTANYTQLAKDVKVKCLREMATGEVSACGRNWYLTEARLVEGLDLRPPPHMIKGRVYAGELYDLFLLLTVMVDFEKAQRVTKTAHFHFTDLRKGFVLKLRRGLVELIEVEEWTESSDLTVTTSEPVWRGILAKDKSPSMAAMKGEIEVNPGILSLQHFMGYFDTEQ